MSKIILTLPRNNCECGTNIDTDWVNFSEYIEKLQKYWQEQESNELSKVNEKTYNNPLPKRLNCLTVDQRDILNRKILLHRQKMLQNAIYIEFKLRHMHAISQIRLFNHMFEEYKKNNPIKPDTPCPCCRVEDYITESTLIVKE